MAGTLVKTKEGDKPIEQVEEGDYLLAQDEATGKLSYKKVLKKHIIFEKEKIYHLYIGKEVIKVTGKHPFRIGSKWVEVQYLHVGDSVTLATGNRLAIDSIAVINGAYTVYNFTVEDYHTYYVSKTGVLVHNCPDDDKKVGSYGHLTNDKGDDGKNITELNHMPAYNALIQAGLDKEEGMSKYLAIALKMDKEDHRVFLSTGSSSESKAFRAKIAELLKQGKYEEAISEEVNQLNKQFGNKYSKPAKQVKEGFLDKIKSIFKNK